MTPSLFAQEIAGSGMKWLRLYDDLVFNAKVQSLPPKLFKHLINLWCLASRNEPRGYLPSLDRVSFALRMRPERVSAVLLSLISRGFLSEVGQIHDWNALQFKSDDSALRKQVQRNKHIDEKVTGQSRDSHVPDSDTEQIQNRYRTDTEQIQNRAEQTTLVVPQQYPVDFERFWLFYPKKSGKGEALKSWKRNAHPGIEAILEVLARAKACEDWKRENGRFIPNPATWLNQKRWDDDYGPKAKAERGLVL